MNKHSTAYLTSSNALPQLLGHQAVLNVRKLRPVLEMVLGQEHVPQAQPASLPLQIVHDARMALPSRVADPDLRRVHRVRGDTFFVDEFLDLLHEITSVNHPITVHTSTSVPPRPYYTRPYIPHPKASSPGPTQMVGRSVGCSRTRRLASCSTITLLVFIDLQYSDLTGVDKTCSSGSGRGRGTGTGRVYQQKSASAIAGRWTCLRGITYSA